MNFVLFPATRQNERLHIIRKVNIPTYLLCIWYLHTLIEYTLTISNISKVHDRVLKRYMYRCTGRCRVR
jgi:replicative DNA helicase